MMELIKAADDMELAHDWVSDILKRSKLGLTDEDLNVDQAADYVGKDMRAVMECNVLWLLSPKTPTSGAWVEYGIGLVARQVGRMAGQERHVICSGPDIKHHLFGVAADAIFSTDELAWQWLRLQVSPPSDSQRSAG